jgi:hypothetical protein
MAEETTGASAEVGVRKTDEDGEVIEERGYLTEGHSRRGVALFLLLVVLSLFGIWQIVELLSALL